MRRTIVFTFILMLLAAARLDAQTTEFTYQGRLNDGAIAATGSYDFEFVLFNAATNGMPLGTRAVPNVTVTNGVFTVTLDFGAAFPGAGRWLEIHLKPSGNADPYTILTPRQAITSAPYAVKSVSSDIAATATNSNQLGGVNASEFIQNSDARLTNNRNPTAGSANYVQNTAVQQAASNFNISGTGTANVFRAATQFNIGANRVLGVVGIGNLFVGTGAGTATSGALATSNSFFGINAGNLNFDGFSNSFFGRASGASNTSGNGNSFFGSSAGFSNTVGLSNAFFGTHSGFSNTTGDQNSFFGAFAGEENTTAGSNSFFGHLAGRQNTGGTANSFFGRAAGLANTLGTSNNFFGASAGFQNTTGERNTFIGEAAGSTNETGSYNTAIGSSASVGSSNLTYATAIGARSTVFVSNTIAMGRSDGSDRVLIWGLLDLNILGAAGSTQLCRNASGHVASCSSSLRYKTNVQPFNSGLNLINRLKPITFDWKDGGMADVGLGAEDVAAVEPLLVSYNNDGHVEGVKYDRIGVVLLNAVKEQQAQIENQEAQLKRQRQNATEQQKRIDELQKLIEVLKAAVCAANPQLAACQNHLR